MKTATFLIAALFALGIARAQEPSATIRISGSNVFGEKLGPLVLDAFSKRFPGITVNLKRPGSGPGLAALMKGTADIAPTSRPADAKELAAAKAAGLRLRSQAIGSYGVAVIVNEKNPLTGLKPAQVRGIFNGKITNWKEVGGPDREINLFVLNKSTGARVGFQLLAMKGDDYAPSARPLRDYEDIAREVAADPAAIGYTGIGPALAGTRALLINGQPPNTAAIYERVYPYANTLFLYTVAGRETPTAAKFIKFVLSREGQRVLQEAGYAPRLPAPLSAAESIAF